MKRIGLAFGLLVVLPINLLAQSQEHWMARPRVNVTTPTGDVQVQTLHRLFAVNQQLTPMGHAVVASLPEGPRPQKDSDLGSDLEKATGLKWHMTKQSGFVTYVTDWEAQHRRMIIHLKSEKGITRVLALHVRSPWADMLETEGRELAVATFEGKVARHTPSWLWSEAYAQETKPRENTNYYYEVSAQCREIPPRIDAAVNVMSPKLANEATRKSAKALGILSLNFIQDLQGSVLVKTLEQKHDPRTLTIQDYEEGFKAAREADESLNALDVNIGQMIATLNGGQPPSQLAAEIQSAQQAVANVGSNSCNFEVDLKQQVQQLDMALKGNNKGLLCERVNDMIRKYNEGEAALQDARRKIARSAMNYFALQDRELGKQGLLDESERNKGAAIYVSGFVGNKGLRVDDAPCMSVSEALSYKGGRRKAQKSRAFRQLKATECADCLLQSVNDWMEFIDGLCRVGSPNCPKKKELVACAGGQITTPAPVAPPVAITKPSPSAQEIKREVIPAPRAPGPDMLPGEKNTTAAPRSKGPITVEPLPPPGKGVGAVQAAAPKAEPDDGCDHSKNEHLYDFGLFKLCGVSTFDVTRRGGGGGPGPGGHGGKGGEHGGR